MASCSVNLGRTQNHSALFDHYLFCSLRQGSLGRNIYEHAIKDRYQDAPKLNT